MPPKRKKVARKRRGAKNQNILTAVDVYAIAQNEYYNALLNAGFKHEVAMAFVMDKDALPNWMIPNPPSEQIPIYDPEDDEDDD
jgi:hypothetical protein